MVALEFTNGFYDRIIDKRIHDRKNYRGNGYIGIDHGYRHYLYRYCYCNGSHSRDRPKYRSLEAAIAGCNADTDCGCVQRYGDSSYDYLCKGTRHYRTNRRNTHAFVKP